MFGDEFPVNKLREILHHVAAHPTTTRPAVAKQLVSPFPRVECRELFAFLTRLIQKFSEALVRHGVESDVFDTLKNPRWDFFYLLWDWRPLDAEETHPLGIAEEFPRQEADRLFHEAAAILRRLESDPSHVVPAPKYLDGTVPIFVPTDGMISSKTTEVSTPAWKRRIYAEVEKATITLDNVQHQVNHEVAVWFHELWKVEGRWVSFPELQNTIRVLKSKRPDRIWKQLPLAVQPYVEKRTGAGSRLKIEMLGQL